MNDSRAGQPGEQAPGERPAEDAAPSGAGSATAGGRLPVADDEQEGTGPLWQRMAAQRWGEGGAARAVGAATLAIAVAFGLFQGYTALFVGIDIYVQRVVHLMFVLVLVFLLKPAARFGWARSAPMAAVDLLLVAVAVGVSLYPVLNRTELLERVAAPTPADIAVGAIALVLLLEACRRTIGPFMAFLGAVFLFYAWIGPLLPGALAHGGYLYQRIVAYTYFSADGVFGVPLGVAATFVFAFIFFGALLQKSGGGDFFIGLAYALTGRYTGGPAKGAVVGSALMGSITGSAIANTVTTGAFTIPMMKRVGYSRHESAGVEAAASTGGQLLPPVMGAGAFVMAEMMGVPYADIVKVAIIPALMYFAVVFLFVDILARKNGIGGLPADQIPRLRTTLAAGWHFIAPLVLLITLLLAYVPPLQAGMYAIGALFAVAMLRSASRLTLADMGEVFALTARNVLAVSVATGVAGIIVGVVGLTGLGLKLSGMIVGAAAGSLLLTLVLVALASLVLGLGLPVTAAYIVLIVLAGPALTELGLPLIVAHMIVYWYSQDSNVTPPVALAAFSASGIAGASPTRTGFAAWKFAKGLYLIPVLMAYSAIMLDGSLGEIVFSVVGGMVGLVAFAVALEGFLLRPARLWERALLLVSGVLVFMPGTTTDLVGIAVTAALVALQFRGRRPAPRPEAATAPAA
ncbi:TRAP transporter permease [Nocardiopsis baichengensis]|uniref:TRAP transporter permease n=1 Tax=Nocardiopsis baichengensis TaxID=280240 RepID=UPI000344A607|nr:TRAP transporter permease [Nocardiopsis baichengensis]